MSFTQDNVVGVSAFPAGERSTFLDGLDLGQTFTWFLDLECSVKIGIAFTVPPIWLQDIIFGFLKESASELFSTDY